MEYNLEDPHYKSLFEAIKSVYDRHNSNQPLNYVNVSEFVQAIIPAVEDVVKEEVANAIHPDFGWYWRGIE